MVFEVLSKYIIKYYEKWGYRDNFHFSIQTFFLRITFVENIIILRGRSGFQKLSIQKKYLTIWHFLSKLNNDVQSFDSMDGPSVSH